MFMFADQAKETGHPDAIVDALSRPTAPHLEMSFGRGNNGFPAISMTQHAANKYAEWLSAKTGEYYRLPTEAEWEYACRAGSPAEIPAAQLGDYAWFVTNSPDVEFSRGTYHLIGTKKPNAWGLYDMLGNVMEWTLDQYKPYASAEAENPWVRSTTSYPHAVRGGSWNDEAAKVSCTARVASEARWKRLDPQLPKSVWYMTNAQWLGFRLIRPAKLPTVEDMYRAWNNGVEVDPY
jgi:formylglycine-generating enzyme required for sulfatase activity